MTANDTDKLNVLVIIGHPRQDSFSHAIAQQYIQSLDAACCTAQCLDLAQVEFVHDVTTPSPKAIALETALAQAQEQILWANHVVFVYPNWWGTFPARLKAFFDRAFAPGFAFYEDHVPGIYQPLLKGKTAELFVTMDTPPFVYEHLLGRPGHRAMAKCTLGFCGIKPTHVTSFGIMKGATAQQRQTWLNTVSARAQGLSRWHTKAQVHLKRLAWLKLLRLQFYPMSLLAFAIGSLAANVDTGQFSWPLFLFGYLTLFCFKAATVFTNEIVDLPTDRRNEHYSPFNGGSRVLVDGDLTVAEVKRAIGGLLLGALGCALAVYVASGQLSAIGLMLLLLISALMTLGYTSPPFKWIYRGWGEVAVGLSHSFLPIVSGYFIQTGDISSALPWLLSLPICFAILPAIILSAIPDHDADRATGKRTLAVIYGPQRAVRLAMFTLIAAGVLTVFLWPWLMDSVAAYIMIALMLWHGRHLYNRLNQFHANGAPVQRINLLMVNALAFILWPSVIALVDLVVAS